MGSTQDRSMEVLKDKFLKELGIENPTEEQRRKLEGISENSLMKPIIQRMIKEGKSYGQIINAIGKGCSRDAMISRIHRIKKESIIKMQISN